MRVLVLYASHMGAVAPCGDVPFASWLGRGECFENAETRADAPRVAKGFEWTDDIWDSKECGDDSRSNNFSGLQEELLRTWGLFSYVFGTTMRSENSILL